MAAALLAAAATAETSFPPPGWQDAPDPIASPHAVRGGTLRFGAFQPPKSLNYYIDNNTFTRQVFAMMYETLLGEDPITEEFAPGLACRWRVSDDSLTYTFDLDPEAAWSDGRPVTAEDVKWTFDQIMDPRHTTGAMKSWLGGIFESVEAFDARTVRFRAKMAHWRNLLAAGAFPIMPSHAFEGQDFNKLNFDSPVVSGPYALSGVKEQVEIQLARRWDWWAGARPSRRNTMNFDTVVFRYFNDPPNAFEAFKKGLIDVYAVHSARLWAVETTGEKFDKNWIVKRHVRNHNPVGFRGFAMNMRRPPFDDVRVRQAIAHLVDRETANRTMMYNLYFLQSSYFTGVYDAANPCTNMFFNFDVAKAQSLLRDAGYAMNPQTGILEKDGKPLSFKFLTRDASSDKILALCDTAFKQAGIRMEIVRKDFAAWMRDMDEFNFDITMAAWTAGRPRDPESLWHSAEADRPSGNNITGFKDPRVDALIEQQKTCYSLAERNAMLREIDALITAEVPYVLLWDSDGTRLVHWDKFGMPPTVLPKFGDERELIGYWWHDADTAAELKSAMATGGMMPPRPVAVDFDSTFKPPLK